MKRPAVVIAAAAWSAVIGAAVGTNSDLLVVGGAYQFLPARPFVPGKRPAGVVRACGPGVSIPKVGDRVLAMAEQGGYAEAVTVPADRCYRLPAGMSFSAAASLSLVYDTAWFALRERGRLAKP